MTVRDRIGRASLHAIAAENAAGVINVVNGSVPFAGGNPVRVRVLGRLNVDAICRARSRAQEASYALFQAVFIAVQDVNSPVSRLKMDRLVRVILRHRFAEHVLEGDAEALHHRRKRREYFADWISHRPKVYQTPFRRANLPRITFLKPSPRISLSTHSLFASRGSAHSR